MLPLSSNVRSLVYRFNFYKQKEFVQKHPKWNIWSSSPSFNINEKSIHSGQIPSLQIALAQVKAGNTSENLLNDKWTLKKWKRY